MTRLPFHDLPPAVRRRLLVGAGLRAGLTVSVLVTVYYLVPTWCR